MGPAERIVDLLRDLRAKVDLDSDAREAVFSEISLYAGKDMSERANVTLIAVDLDRYFTSVESTLEAIARGLDGIVPAGPEWHRALLVQMSKSGPARPAVICEETRSRLEELRRFRHFLRHAYAVTLDWLKLKPLVASLPRTRELLGADIAAFAKFLGDCIEENGSQGPGAGRSSSR